MDNSTYEQLRGPRGLGGRERRPHGGRHRALLFVRDSPLRVELPTFVELAVTKTDPGVKGDTVSNVTKPAQLEPARWSTCPCS